MTKRKSLRANIDKPDAGQAAAVADALAGGAGAPARGAQAAAGGGDRKATQSYVLPVRHISLLAKVAAHRAAKAREAGGGAGRISASSVLADLIEAQAAAMEGELLD